MHSPVSIHGGYFQLTMTQVVKGFVRYVLAVVPKLRP